MPEIIAQRYEVLRPLGSGGMGDVSLVRDQRDGREVALKRLRLVDPEAATRFRDEFSVLARIEHPNIVRVFDYGALPEAEGGGAYFTMEYLDGLPIDEAIGPGEIAPLLRAVLDIAAGLDALSAVGLAHCDLKPSNVMLVGDGQNPRKTQLLDFGFVGSLAETVSQIRGTPGFLAPEVMAGGKYTTASDAYALGATLYRVVTGRPAFPGDSAASVLASQRGGRPAALSMRALGVPRPVETAVLGMLDPAPARRLTAWSELVEIASRQARNSDSGRGRGRGFGGRGMFIGRRSERSRLRAHLLADRIQLGVIGGSEGSGRTRLARELAVEFELKGWDVAWLDADSSRESRRAAGKEPRDRGLLLVLDDVDRWPAAAVRDLDFASMKSPLAILATVDADQASEGWTAPLLELSETPTRRDVSLQPLLSEEVGELVVSRLGSRVPSHLPDFLIRQVGHLPAELHRALDLLIESNGLVESGGYWELDEGAAAAILDTGMGSELRLLLSDLDANVRRALLLLAFDRRGESVDEESIQVLRWRGLLDETVDAIGLRSPGLADRVRGEILPTASSEALAELSTALDDDRSYSVREHRLRGELRLAQGRTDEALSEFIEASRAESDAESPDREASIVLLLDHCAVDTGDGVRFLSEIAELDARSGRNRRAADLWGRLLLSGTSMPAAVRVEMSYKRAHSLNQVGGFAEAIATLDAISFDPALSPIDECDWWARRATALHYYGRIPEAVSDLERALALVPSGELGRQARLENRLAMMLYLNIDSGRGRSLLNTALRHAETAKDESLVAIIVGNFGLMARMEGKFDQAENHQREAIERHQRDGNDQELGLTLASLASTLSNAARWDDFEVVSRQVTEIARRRKDPYLLLNLLATQVPAALRRGRLAEARKLQRAERVWLPAVRRLEADLHHRLYRAEYLRLRGLDRPARRLLNSIVAAPESGRLRRYTALAEAMLGRIEARSSSPDSALRRLERARVLRPGDSLLAGIVDVELSRLSSKRPKAEAAQAALTRLTTMSKAPGTESGAHEEARAWVELAGNNVEAAESHFRGALAAHLAVESRTAGIELAWCAGLALAARDRTVAGLGLLREAHALAGGSGMRVWAQRLADEILAVDSRHTQGNSSRGSFQEWDTLQRVGEVLNSALEPSTLLPRALALVCDRMGAERGFILLNVEGADPRPVAQYGHVDDDSQVSALDISRTLIRRVTASGSSFRADDAATDPRLGSTLSVFDLSMRSILCTPLRLGASVIGTIYLENRTAAGQFDEQHLELVEAFANLVAVAIQNARLHEELKKSRDRVLGENLNLRREVGNRFRSGNVVGQSAEVERILLDVERMAPSRATILITGESGTGKDLIAKTIHFASPRSSRALLSLNCAALPADLIESELFGIEDHVATGVRSRAGIFERADGGSLFLDEIGDMPLSLQAKLLRVLQEREFVRIGGTRVIRVDFRLIAATNKDLQTLIKDGAFREDLYFRLSTLPLHLPPLRDRKVDVIPLAEHFLRRFCEENSLPEPRMTAEFRASLLRSMWPGNVRELQNHIERSVIMSPGSTLEPIVLPSDLDAASTRAEAGRGRTTVQVDPDAAPGNLKAALEDAERRWIRSALRTAEGNQRQAATLLGIAEPTLRYRMSRLRIGVERALEVPGLSPATRPTPPRSGPFPQKAARKPRK